MRTVCVGVTAVDNGVVVRTLAGAAKLVAALVDDAMKKGIIDGMLGTVAGNDSIFIVCRDAQTASTIARNLPRAMRREGEGLTFIWPEVAGNDDSEVAGRSGA